MTLEQFIAGTPRRYLAVRDKAMHSLGIGTTHDMSSVLSGVIWPSLRSPHYSLGEKIRLWHGKFSSGVSALWDDMLAVDLAEPRTVAVDMSGKLPPRLIGIAWHRDRVRTAASQGFIDLAAEVCAEIASRPLSALA